MQVTGHASSDNIFVNMAQSFTVIDSLSRFFLSANYVQQWRKTHFPSMWCYVRTSMRVDSKVRELILYQFESLSLKRRSGKDSIRSALTLLRERSVEFRLAKETVFN